VSATPSQGTYAAVSGDWDVGSITSGDVITLQIRARIDTTAQITNSAEITRGDQFDPDSTPGNNKNGEDDTASISITPVAADLSVEKTAAPNAATLNQPVVYTIVVRNAGPGAADAVRVTDLLPAGVTFTNATATQGTYNAGSGLWSVGTLANGADATLTINVLFTSTSPATITNYAQVDSATPDPNAINNTAKAPVKAKEVDLVVGKIVLTPASAQVPVGGLATFRVTVRNANAVDAATNVKMQDLLPAGVQFVSATASSGSYASGNGLWFIPIVNANTTETLDIVVKMTGLTPQINIAKLTGLDQYETGPGANEASATLTPIYLDLLMTKTVSPVAPGIGDSVSFTLGVHNNGPSDATGVFVSDKLPPGVAFVSAIPAAQYDAITGIWTVGNIPASTTATLVINTTFTGPGSVLNTARVTAVDQPDTDLNNNESSATLPSQIADLALTKTADNTEPKPNDVVTFTITLKNNGPDAATSPSVNDAVPAGFTVLSTSPSQGTYTAPTWAVGPLSNGASATLVIVARMTGTAPQVNTATATNPSQQDPNAGNNQQSVTITPQRAELTITKTVAATPVNVTGNAVFTVTVSNAGPSAATNVIVADLLPVGLTFAGAAPGAGVYDELTGLWKIDLIAASGSATLTVTARVDGRGPYVNTATVTGLDQLDDPAGNSASVSVRGVSTDMRIQKTVTPSNPLPGQAITFQITTSNGGPDDANDVKVTELLPFGFALSNFTAGSGTYDPSTGLWLIGTLVPTQPALLTINGTFVGPASLTNVASVTSSTHDFDPSNNIASVTIPSQVADIKVRKSVDQTNADFGSNVTFTVIVDNAGPEAATNARVADALPAGLTYVSHNTATGAYVPSTGLWSVGALSNGGSATLTIVATVSGTAPAQNKATAQADQFDPDTSSNTATADVVPRAANLRIAKNVSNAQPVNGEILTFTLVATNDGPSAATPVTVADALPAGLTLVDYVATQGNYAAGIWNVGALSATENATLTVRARYAATGSAVVNTATISSPVPDPDPSDNTRSIGVPAQIADLSLAKTVSNATPTLGGNVTYTITTRNAGPDGATGVVVRDTLPAGLLLVSATPSQGTYDAATGNWSVGAVANAGNATLTIIATVTGTQAIANVAEITKSDQFDPNSSPNNGDATENDQASATITPQFADLRTSKTVDNPQPGNNEIVAFTVEVLNSGNAAAPNVIVNDALPAGLSFVAATPSTGTYSSATGVWTVGTLATNARATLTILATYTANGLKVTNTARATSDLPDPNPADNAASVTVPAEIADLSINKTVAPPRPQVGGEVTFTIVLSNAGPDTAKQVKVRDQLPAGLQYLSSTVSQGSYNAATGMWDVGTINNAANATLTIRAKVLSASAGQNIAEVTSSAQFDPNSVPNNARAAENDQSIAQFAPQVSNLAVQKTASVLNPVPAQPFAYSIKVTNNGPDVATNVSVSEALPAGIAFASASATQGAYDAATGLWPVGALANGASATLTLNVIYNGPGVVVNTASATSDQFDPDLTDNAGRIAVPSQIADLKITKTVNDAAPNRGTNMTFTIEVENLGPDAATNAEIIDALPAGLTLVSANASAGAYVNATGKWTIPTLANAAKATLTIVATATGDAAITNTARITKLDQFDPATGNNVSQAVVTPQVANLSIAKSVNNTKPAANELLTYTIIVRNAGPSTARAVRVNESLPAGLTYVSNTVSDGTFDAGTGVWAVGDLANAAQATLTLSARYTAPGTVVTNSVSVTSTTPDSDTTNNAASQAVPSDGPDLTIVKRALPGAIQGGSVTYEFVVSNVGGAASIGEVTITDVLPAGLSVALPLSPTINGWACLVAGQTLTCKRSDPLLGSGASYPTLSITAKLAQNVAIGALDNTAAVSGGGDVIATNNRSTATTQVAQFIEINVPTLSAWLMALLSFVLLGFAARRIRRDLH
jgi:large repetitive protein